MNDSSAASTATLRHSRSRRPLIALLALSAVAALAYIFRPYNAVREFGLDTPATPSPNAHDLYLQAARTIRSQPVALLLDPKAKSGDVDDPQKYPLAAKKQWLTDNARGFALFDQAQKAAFYFPPIRTPQQYGAIEPPLELRYLARYKSVQTETLAQQGQHEQAVQNALAGWKFGLDAGHGAPLTPGLAALGFEAIARQSLNPEIAYLNGAQAARSARQLEQLLATRVPFQAVLREERAAMLVQQKRAYEQAIFDNAQSQRNKAAIERGDYKSVHYSSDPAPELKSPLVNWTIRRLGDHYARSMDALIAQADVPWPQRPADPPQVSGAHPKMASLMGVVHRSRFPFARAQAQGNLFLARLALHAYRKDTGRYPASLHELAPRYLKAVPQDPFSSGQPLRYRIEGKRYQLWSLGPDARDDGARPIQKSIATYQKDEDGFSKRDAQGHRVPGETKISYLVTADSQGDIVANINR